MQEFEPESLQSARCARSEKKRAHPRENSPARLERIALHYLGRYASSAAHLREVLRRRAQRSAEFHGQDMREVTTWIDAMVERFVEKGYVNDRSFAEAEIRRLRRRGSSTCALRATLRKKGVPAALVEELLGRQRDDDAELRAACAYARRRRMGPYRTDPAQRVARRDKDLAAMARAGFSRDVAYRIVGAALPAVLEEGLSPDF